MRRSCAADNAESVEGCIRAMQVELSPVNAAAGRWTMHDLEMPPHEVYCKVLPNCEKTREDIPEHCVDQREICVFEVEFRAVYCSDETCSVENAWKVVSDIFPIHCGVNPRAEVAGMYLSCWLEMY